MLAWSATVSVENGVPRVVDPAGADDTLVAGVSDGSSLGADGPFFIFYTDIAEPAVTPGPGCSDEFLPACAFGATPPASASVDMGAGKDSLRFGVYGGARTVATVLGDRVTTRSRPTTCTARSRVGRATTRSSRTSAGRS